MHAHTHTNRYTPTDSRWYVHCGGEDHVCSTVSLGYFPTLLLKQFQCWKNLHHAFTVSTSAIKIWSRSLKPAWADINRENLCWYLPRYQHRCSPQRKKKRKKQAKGIWSCMDKTASKWWHVLKFVQTVWNKTLLSLSCGGWGREVLQNSATDPHHRDSVVESWWRYYAHDPDHVLNKLYKVWMGLDKNLPPSPAKTTLNVHNCLMLLSP